MEPDCSTSSSSESDDGLLSEAAMLAAVNGTDEADFDSQPSPRSDSPAQDEQPTVVTLAARAYQLEMLEKSFKENIIVALGKMDTGSGKTQVAILRIQAEIERSDKIAWFLAPTVALAQQQFEVIRAQTQSVRSRLIVGSDNVEAWSSKPGVWDAVLLNIRIVVSTYQILFDAVSHALVPLESLCLIVVDEAHNCGGKKSRNAVARLMREHYAPRKEKGLYVPHILGLTASPLMKSNLAGLEELERTLDAVIRTPSKHRDELLAQVNRPEMKTVPYAAPADDDDNDNDIDLSTLPALENLWRLCVKLDIRQDPYIRYLLERTGPKRREKLQKAIMKRKTYCMRSLTSLGRRTQEMYLKLGPWAAEYYLYEVISDFTKPVDGEQQPGDSLQEQERRYLADIFQRIGAKPPPTVPTDLSPKVQALLDVLESHEGDPIGIIFVKERATVAVLSHILANHPKTSHRYRVGSMVGTSKMPGKRRDFLDLAQKDYLLSLGAFRAKKTNLVVATSVLEEGIDVPACNLVICFDEPDNLKAFIQRRGRARMSESELYLLVKSVPNPVSRDWQALEAAMKRKYEDEMRQNPLLEQLETAVADPSELNDYPILRDPDTGAQITLHDAKPHLEHFCATLRSRKFVDWNPYYVLHTLDGEPIVDARQPGLRRATVHLPVSLPPELRKFQGLHAWLSEAAACRDAAFQAYEALYKAGLVNKHLLPVTEDDLIPEGERVGKREGMAMVRGEMEPWGVVARAWKEGKGRYRRRMRVESPNGEEKVVMDVVMPVPVPYMAPLELHWDHGPPWRVEMDIDMCQNVGGEETNGDFVGHDQSIALLELAFGHRRRLETDKQYPVSFVLADGEVNNLTIEGAPVTAELLNKLATTHLVRDVTNSGQPYFPVSYLPTKPAAELVGKAADEEFENRPENTPYVVVKKWPKAIPLFHPAVKQQQPVASTKPYPRIVPAEQLRVDNVPAVYSRVGFLIPAITHALGIHLVARDLLETRLQDTGITDLSLVVSAITARAAREWTDYERLEFLGDSILKFCTTVNICAKHLKYPEGILSPLKDKLVSNSRLSRAAISSGLDHYIIHQQFQLRKWRPTYIQTLLSQPPSQSRRLLSTKTLADVIESLIGASYLSRGASGALACMALFLPSFTWQSVEKCRSLLFADAPEDEALPKTMVPLEPLLGHTFARKALLVEAFTHGSCSGPGVRASLDRLEFLGDAVLDYVVVNKLFAYSDPAPLEPQTLHLLRTALVNADILGFLVMEWCATVEGAEVDVAAAESSGSGNSDDDDDDDDDGKEDADVTIRRTETKLPLWSFLRHASPDMGLVQRATAQRHAAMRGEILEALWRGGRYPWTLLARLQAHKFYSDVFESVLGAVWVDCAAMVGEEEEGGERAAVKACEQLVERIGILPLMRRLVRDKVELLHPKEELGRLACGERVDYEVVAVGEVGEEDGETTFSCKVLVGGECLGTAEGAWSRLEARTKAAEVACEVLRARKAAKVNGEVGEV
ncbi:hypothetical protein VTJ49DRAFT_6722 [Mycothermus thermophilus]|uniref:Dicer-like protein 2 n=1 Tax=Humicola insolens TaxID=85995 RepID=A0ABR3VJZ6_HUMIN